ncbi:hypothetical protein SAMN05428969_0840 [Devosia sp. YR412]|uniref:hypothetical protein n=1 Tax=Devosia sp. YR412 TaxID=1881030 RepID=UPI0008B0425A|nr:hypothetical protein [Devosia sp. YR412]SEP77247.1 hypothetical protein SAMN05428969_0840 [Devosia sp. YR412]
MNVFDMEGEMSPSQIEQTELTAAFLNALASGTILAAPVAPYIGMGMRTLSTDTNILNLTALSAFCVVLGIKLHLIGRRQLQRLEE